MGKYVKRLPSSRRQKLWGSCVCVLHQFSVSPRIYMPILPTNYKKITKHFQYGYKTETRLKHIMYYTIFQNRPHMCKLPNHMAWCIMRIVYFAIYKWLAVCDCWFGWSGCLCVLCLCGHLGRESVSVFDGLVYLYV